VYPLLSIAFQRFLLSNVPATSEVYRIGVESEQEWQMFALLMERGERILDRQRQRLEEDERKGTRPLSRPGLPGTDEQEQDSRLEYYDVPDPQGEFPSLEEAVQGGYVDLGVRIRRVGGHDQPSAFQSSFNIEFVALDHPFSRRTLEHIESRLEAVNDRAVRGRLQQARLDERPEPILVRRQVVEDPQATAAGAFSSLVPLVLILMTITGAVYPAIDLTAGERERGTLEALIAAPVPRLGLLTAKYVVVLIVALLTATINLVSMTVTVLSVGLGDTLFGEAGLTAAAIVQVFLLLGLFAAFFSALLLAVTSFARSFKEAQAYLVPLMLVSIAPGLLSLMPGLDLSGPLAVTPLVNIVLLARDVLEHRAAAASAVLVVISTAVYALAALSVAARVFGTDAILYGSSGSWTDLLRRPAEPRPFPRLSTALTCLALMFPAFVLLPQFVAQMRGLPLSTWLACLSAISAVLFVGLPLAAAVWRRVRLRSGFALAAPPWWSLPAAVVLGLSLWPFAHELVVLADMLGVWSISEDLKQQARETVGRLRALPAWLIIFHLAIVPAAVEELFFRGFLQGALSARTARWKAIVLSGVLFGLFHLVARDSLAFERLLPSTFLGLVLGWIRDRTGSVWPGMLLHACHNGFLLLVGYYEPVLRERGWGVETQSHLPSWWLAAGAVGVAAGVAIVWAATRRERV
ncbi:MAG: ABC transporter permease subunit/CPBP intramembrane protease, partial [Planctomycetaceae bacterium]